ncbi:hypothetical protein C7388_10339 [Methylobacterium radiotolerans]|nr:hypothetical protein C7388_10339 [Methylobacterium organophilum]
MAENVTDKGGLAVPTGRTVTPALTMDRAYPTLVAATESRVLGTVLIRVSLSTQALVRPSHRAPRTYR